MCRCNIRVLRVPVMGVVLSLGLLALGTAGALGSEVIVLRSGNAPVGSPDPQINALVGSGASPLSPNPFTAADFGAACGLRSAYVINPHPAWLQSLACDPQAQWIGIDPSATPASALYCQEFTVQTCCIQSATLQFCWAGDDAIGDGIYGGPNLDGVYINGVPVAPSINTGNYAVQTQTGAVDVTGMLQCGSNQLQIYNRDAALVVSGIIYNATFDIKECSVPTVSITFGLLKARYR